MASPGDEDRLIARALERGFIAQEDIAAADAAALEGTAAFPEAGWGKRLHHLVRSGRLSESAIVELAHELGQTPYLPGGPSAAPPPPAPAPAARPERYELIELLGRGGMGEVYKARDLRLGRIVALKFILGADPHRAARFLQEARAQARIDHPNVCKVYEAGDDGGRPFISMQFVDGQRLDKAASSMSLPEKVQAMKDIAQAMHEAHKLGIVHRDLKPSNILVERGEDGRCFPVVMDFGLAHELTDSQGLTVTGALLGTPSYMSPEQARGDVRGIDRRSDVYGLGATLYELLTGAPPFAEPTFVGTVAKVIYDDPPPLRSRVPSLPADLETIALKCLSKDPHQRYPSARALAEDLGRYIDGEPILGQRPSLLSRLRRRARKHRALVAVSAVSLASLLAVSGFGLRTWLMSRRGAQLAERLGQDVKEIEWFLRTSYALPLHDTGPEQRLVRERMASLAAQPHALGTQGEALVQYALGRGHLAMHELEAANEALAQAQERGLDSPELHSARGRVLGELYHQALEAARHNGGKDWLAEQQRALEKRYLEPALQALERSRGLKVESPRYLEGLIAFYRRQYSAAAEAAEKAVAEAPWMYEARKLAGDVVHAQAIEQLDRGDYAAARAGLDESSRHYEDAAAIGRSDPLNYEALAEAWLQRADIDQREGQSQKSSLGKALFACEAAIAAAPLRSSGYTKKAYALMRWYQDVKFRGEKGNPEAVLAAWIAAGTRAVELDPRDVYALDALANGYHWRALSEAEHGRDPNPAWDEAIVRLRQALDLQPSYPWALNDLGRVRRWRGNYQREHGQDPRAELAEAARSFERAAQVDPGYLYAHANATSVYAALARYLLSRGLNPEAELQRAVQSGERSLALDANYHAALNNLADAELTRAEYLLATGADPRPALDRALQHLSRSSRINPTNPRTHVALAQLHAFAAHHALQDGRDPTAELQEARQAAEVAQRLDAGCVDCRVLDAGLALAAAEWAKHQGRPTLPLLQQALADARRAVELYPYFEAHQELARVCWRLAEAQPAREAQAAIAEGLAQVERALQLDPHLAHGYALRGGLLLEQARRERNTAQRSELMRQAQAALARAIELNPLLEREYAPQLAQARE